MSSIYSIRPGTGNAGKQDGSALPDAVSLRSLSAMTGLPHNSRMENLHRERATALPLLATKFHVPGWRLGSVSRRRLVAALDGEAGRKLTLISAPAGFGKSTLLAEWLAAGERSV